MKHPVFPESLMPPSQFAVLGTSGPLFKTVLQFWTHVCMYGREDRGGSQAFYKLTEGSKKEVSIIKMSFCFEFNQKHYVIWQLF